MRFLGQNRTQCLSHLYMIDKLNQVLLIKQDMSKQKNMSKLPFFSLLYLKPKVCEKIEENVKMFCDIYSIHIIWLCGNVGTWMSFPLTNLLESFTDGLQRNRYREGKRSSVNQWIPQTT